MSTFVLVHGAWHGGWCWERLIPELEGRDHRAIPMDLPCDTRDADLEQYADVVVAASAHVDGPVVVVGHSFGGFTIPLIPERRPVERLIFLNAIVPRPGLSHAEFAASEPFMVPGQPFPNIDARAGWSTWTDRAAARTTMYHDCSIEDADWAFGKLRRQSPRPGERPHPLRQWPDVPSSYVLGADDRIVDAAWSRRIATDWLGTTAVELPGSHSPFLAQPGRLAEVLDGLVR